MPLHLAEGAINSKLFESASEQYLVFYSSIVDGKSWCPDCRDVEVLVNQTFSPSSSPSAIIVYVGDRSEWKSPRNAYRAEPWRLTDIPTIIRFRDGVEDGRLVEKDIGAGLVAFIDT